MTTLSTPNIVLKSKLGQKYTIHFPEITYLKEKTAIYIVMCIQSLEWNHARFSTFLSSNLTNTSNVGHKLIGKIWFNFEMK